MIKFLPVLTVLGLITPTAQAQTQPPNQFLARPPPMQTLAAQPQPFIAQPTHETQSCEAELVIYKRAWARWSACYIPKPARMKEYGPVPVSGHLDRVGAPEER